MPFPGMRTGYKSPEPSNPLQGIIDWAVNFAGPTSQYRPSNVLGDIGRSAKADQMWQPGVRNFPAGYKENELRAGQAAENFRKGAGFPGQRPTPIVTGTQDGSTPDRTQSDLYKQYALNPQGQFDRYFGSSEMDPYFGAASRGAGAPKDLAAMESLAGMGKAPVGTPLSTYYRAQSAAGRGNMDEIVSSMGYKGPMAEWAKANPMLAQREFNKRFPAGEPTIGRTPSALQADEALKGVTKFFPGAEPDISSAQPMGSEDFAVAANAVPAPWNQQGAKVSADFSGVVPFQASKTTGEGMPAFQTTGQKAEEFLRNAKFSNLF